MPLPRYRGATRRSPVDLLDAVYQEQMMNQRPGEEPSGIAMNDYLANIEPTYEQEREGDVLESMDTRVDESMGEDRKRIQAINDIVMGEDPRVKGRRQEDRAFEIARAGEPARVIGEAQRDVQRIAGEHQERVANIYSEAGLTPRGGLISGSTMRPTVPRVATNRALDESVRAARGGGNVAGGLGRQFMNFFGLGKEGGASTMEVDPGQMDSVIADYQAVMTEQGVPMDVQDAAIALVSKFPGLRPEEKIAKLAEIGYDPTEITPEDQAMLLRTLRMTGGF